MEKQINNSPVFHLVIDEERCELLQVMFGMCHRAWDDFEHHAPDRAIPLEKCILAMIKEVSEKMHERGWCKDPNCSENKPV